MRGSTRARRKRSIKGKREVGSSILTEWMRKVLTEGREGTGLSDGPRDWRLVTNVLRALTAGSFCNGPSLARSFSRGGSLVKVTGLSCGRWKLATLRLRCGCGGCAIWTSKRTFPCSCPALAPDHSFSFSPNKKVMNVGVALTWYLEPIS